MKFIKHQVTNCKKYIKFHNYTFGNRGEKIKLMETTIFNKFYNKLHKITIKAKKD